MNGDGLHPAWLNLAWLRAEWPAAVTAFAVTSGRLLLALALGFGLGAGLAALMRRSPRSEAALTPWLLGLLAVPWALILVTLNLIPTLGVRDGTAVTVAALAAAVQIFALGRRKLEEQREAYLQRALTYAFTAIVASELLARSDGLGGKIRFYTLFTQYPQLLLYLTLALLLWGLFTLAGRALKKGLGRTFLGRSA